MVQHIAIIMDGNHRWAKKHSLPRGTGHKQGAEAAREIIKLCPEFGIKYLTLYAFSSENWNRPEDEVTEIMGILRFYLGRELKSLHKNGVRLKIIGDCSRLSKDISKDIKEAEELTRNNEVLFLNIALSYGSRQEIISAVRKLIADNKPAESLAEYLYTRGIPDPDLLIRTGGDQRLSNFLLWQSAYTELYFTPTLWPDFKREDLLQAIETFNKRERRYGKRA